AMVSRPITPIQTARRSDAVHGRRTSRARGSNLRNFIVTLSWVLAVAIGPSAALAHGGNFQGVVLGIAAGRGELIVRRSGAPGIPATTLAVRVIPGKALQGIRIGDRVAGQLNQAAHPPALTEVEVLPQAPPQALPAIRRVDVLQEGQRVPQTAFIDQDGRPFTMSSFLGRNVVLAFIYTRCKDARMCPLISAKFGQLQDQFAKTDTHLVEITLDPVYDTPPVLRKYATVFGTQSARWTLGTGDPNAVLDFAAQFGLQPFADPTVGLIHSERTVVIDKRGVIRYLVDDPAWSTSGIGAQIDILDHRQSNVLAQFDLALSRAAVAVCGNSVAGFSGLVDLVVFLGILSAFGWGFYRVGRAIAGGKS
ncbi:MAG: SCO family protein, partial [Candidatus Eremiobacteraeota bacterium]|nr:SCO family protein [Candidatus Eremiobacteraeota bacterium]